MVCFRNLLLNHLIAQLVTSHIPIEGRPLGSLNYVKHKLARDVTYGIKVA